ncbi:hypothetical protein CAPNMURICA_17 [Arthrobacter phage CapnMurica]|uniref:Uncharacterized protein n=1 Tax=Arthrobacter phage CapnMurica TaxID=1772294 RepID=A0A0U3TI65_9CAUD|nr:hypothetical protein FDH68_gp17 [Arthrobacter phage CaptnMurica]ALY08617.1 hypothetical protein CAPNMURICA_17 [Arthrobacter phage CaptnMurica]
MLKITIPGIESWDNQNQEFVYSDEVELELEHSLVSLSKWEEEFEKPFLSETPKTSEETLAYFRHMTLTPDIAPEVYDRLTNANVEAVNEYIGAKRTATWFNEAKNKRPPTRKETVTSEIIYNWMLDLKIPFDRETWHLNKLITLIKVRNEKNAPNQKRNKMTPREIAQRNRELNEQRLAKLGTTG